MKTNEIDEMKDEYDFSGGRRGVFAGLVEKHEKKEIIESLAVCLKTEDFMNLIPRKIYNVSNYDNELIKLIDETGAEVVYPAHYFLILSLSAEAENIIEKIAA